MNKKLIPFLKLTFIAILIFCSYSNLIISGIYWGSETKTIKDPEAQVIGWISENIPQGSEILIENSYALYYIEVIANCHTNWMSDYFRRGKSNTIYLKHINLLRENNIRYAVFYETHIYTDQNIELFFQNYLIPKFYNETLYEYQDITIYFAPF